MTLELRKAAPEPRIEPPRHEAGSAADSALETSGPGRAADSAGESPPRAWQFDLRTLLLGMAALSGLFGLMAAIGAKASLLGAWTVALVAAHVLANRWGTRVGSRHSGTIGEEQPREPGTRGTIPVPSAAYGPPSPLVASHPQDRAVTYGALAGAALGLGGAGTALGLLYASRGAWIALVFGTLAGGVLGAILGGVTLAGIQVGLTAWREASAIATADERTRRLALERRSRERAGSTPAATATANPAPTAGWLPRLRRRRPAAP